MAQCTVCNDVVKHGRKYCLTCALKHVRRDDESLIKPSRMDCILIDRVRKADAVKDLLRKKYPRKRIASKVKISIHSIEAIARTIPIEERGPHKNKAEFFEYHKAKFKLLLQTEMTQKEIAQHFGVKPDRIRIWKKRLQQEERNDRNAEGATGQGLCGDHPVPSEA